MQKILYWDQRCEIMNYQRTKTAIKAIKGLDACPEFPAEVRDQMVATLEKVQRDLMTEIQKYSE